MQFLISILITLTVLALLCPSAYTIAWSKEPHREEMKVLYIGLGISALTIVGAFLNIEWLMWLGLFCALGFFAYIIFFYKKEHLQ